MTLGATTGLAATVAEARIAAMVHDALACDWLRLHYQPIVELATGAVVGHEALLRLEHPVHGLVPPGVFLPEVEGEDVMEELGRWVIEEALRRTGARWEQGNRAWIAINVAAPQLTRGTVAADIAHALDRHRLPAEAVHVELTETSDLLADIHGRVELQHVTEVGCPVWLDDFGTGYASLSYLQHLEVAGIKIDRSFVASIDEHPRSAAIVAGLMGLADDLGIGVVAEGVERAAEATRLRELGCVFAQGYRFGRPVAEQVVQPAEVIVLR